MSQNEPNMLLNYGCCAVCVASIQSNYNVSKMCRSQIHFGIWSSGCNSRLQSFVGFFEFVWMGGRKNEANNVDISIVDRSALGSFQPVHVCS